MRFIIFCVFQQHFVHICAGILEQLIATIEDDERYLTVTQHAQLIRLLHQTKLTLCKCYLKIYHKQIMLDMILNLYNPKNGLGRCGWQNGQGCLLANQYRYRMLLSMRMLFERIYKIHETVQLHAIKNDTTTKQFSSM